MGGGGENVENEKNVCLCHVEVMTRLDVFIMSGALMIMDGARARFSLTSHSLSVAHPCSSLGLSAVRNL